jgi:hypothetical protein
MRSEMCCASNKHEENTYVVKQKNDVVIINPTKSFTKSVRHSCDKFQGSK